MLEGFQTSAALRWGCTRGASFDAGTKVSCRTATNSRAFPDGFGICWEQLTQQVGHINLRVHTNGKMLRLVKASVTFFGRIKINSRKRCSLLGPKRGTDQGYFTVCYSIWLVALQPSLKKYAGHIGSFPQKSGWTLRNAWNQHLVMVFPVCHRNLPKLRHGGRLVSFFSAASQSVSRFLPNQHLRNGHLGCYRSNQQLWISRLSKDEVQVSNVSNCFKSQNMYFQKSKKRSSKCFKRVPIQIDRIQVAVLFEGIHPKHTACYYWSKP